MHPETVHSALRQLSSTVVHADRICFECLLHVALAQTQLKKCKPSSCASLSKRSYESSPPSLSTTACVFHPRWWWPLVKPVEYSTFALKNVRAYSIYNMGCVSIILATTDHQ